MAEFPTLTSAGPSSLSGLDSLSSLGDQEPEFVNTSDAERFRCPVHRGLLQEPQQTLCGHRLCFSCIETYLAGTKSKLCPVGEPDCESISLDTVVRDNSIVRDIRKALIYCHNRDKGCQEKIRYQFIKEHLSECKFESVSCVFASRGCEEKLLRKQLNEHQLVCPQRPTRCELCQQEVNFCQLQEHKKDLCPETVTGCPFGCNNKTLKRKEVPVHRDVCPVQPVDCKFKAMGCRFTNKRELVEKHEKEDLSAHLELVTVKAAALEVHSLNIQSQLQNMAAERENLAKNMQSSRGQDLGTQTALHQIETQIRDFRLKLVSLMEKVIILERKVPELADRQRLERLEQTMQTVQDRLTQLEARRSDQQGGREQQASRSLLPAGQSSGAAVTITDVQLHHYGQLQNMADVVHQQLTTHDRQLGVHDVRMAEMDLRFQLLETASYDGTLVWKIRDYERRKRDAVNGRTLSLYSQPFYSSRFGYKMCARVYLNGDGMGKTTHMSLFFVVMRGEYDALLKWPFKQKVTLTLLDQSSEARHLTDHFQPDPSSSSFQRPTSEMNVASGCPLFVSHAVLENPQNGYLRDDTIFIRIVVDQNPNPHSF